MTYDEYFSTLCRGVLIGAVSMALTVAAIWSVVWVVS